MIGKTGFHLHGPGMRSIYEDTKADLAIFLDVDLESYRPWLESGYFSPTGGRRAYCRAYHPSILEQSLDDWVGRCKRIVDRYGLWLSGILFENEPNLAREHGIAEDNSPYFWQKQAFWESAEGFRITADWTNRFLDRWGGYFPVGGPALSLDHHDTLGYQILRDVIQRFDFLVLHNYSKPGYGVDRLPNEWAFRDLRHPGTLGVGDPGGAIYLFPNKPYLVSEFNVEFNPSVRADMERSARDAISAYQRWNKDSRCLGLAWFSLGSPDPMRERTWDANRNPHLLTAIKMISKDYQEEAHMPILLPGVKALADDLRKRGIDPGIPLQDEFWFSSTWDGKGLATQATTTGMFVIHKISEGRFESQFYPKT